MFKEKVKKLEMEWIVSYIFTHSRTSEDEIVWTDSCPSKCMRLIRLAGSVEEAKKFIENYLHERKEAIDLLSMMADY